MKHTLRITLYLVFLFLAAQIVGLAIIDKYIDHPRTDVTGTAIFEDLPYQLERPPVDESQSYLYIGAAILIGTILILLIIRFKKVFLWKSWFFIGVGACLAIALAPFIGATLAFLLGFVLAFFKSFRPNLLIHNATELLIYGGLAAIFVPIINLFSVVMLMILISVYDMIAVWGVKHMVKMAKFQSESNVFAGLMIPYARGKKVRLSSSKKSTGKKVKVQTAVLGGGDIGFALLFAGVVMKNLMLVNVQWIGFLKALIIPVFATFALLLLFLWARKDRFYPAMPVISVGCFAGFGVLALLGFI